MIFLRSKRHTFYRVSKRVPYANKAAPSAFVAYHNNQRYHESLINVTPAEVHFGHTSTILKEKKRIEKMTIQKRACNTKNKVQD